MAKGLKEYIHPFPDPITSCPKGQPAYGIKFGQRGPIEVNGITYDNTMMPMGLEDQEVADVMNYIRNRLGNKTEESMVTEAEVSQIGRN